MRLLTPNSARSLRPRHPVATLGVFDGVHRGHGAVIDAVVAWARAAGAPAVVVTFDPHPRALFGAAPPAIADLGQRLAWIAARGVDAAWVMPFDRALAEESAASFARRVFGDTLGARGVALGVSARFGRQRRGDAIALAGWAGAADAEARALPPVNYRNAPVSSTRIREAVAAADLRDAARMLGRPLTLRGVVRHGRALARTLGLPTINLEAPPGRLLPSPGVYAGWVRFPAGDGPRGGGENGEGEVRAADDAGTPAFNAVIHAAPPDPEASGRLIEAHVFGFSGDVYGRTAEVLFGDRLRKPMRFDGSDAARTQLADDAAHARKWLSRGNAPDAYAADMHCFRG